jgi:hypothetical protein
MDFETGEPECLQRQPITLPRIVAAVSRSNAAAPMSTAILASADDAPGREATKAVAHATIYAAVTGTGTAGRELFVTAIQTSVGAYRAIDWANSNAVN